MSDFNLDADQGLRLHIVERVLSTSIAGSAWDVQRASEELFEFVKGREFKPEVSDQA